MVSDSECDAPRPRRRSRARRAGLWTAAGAGAIGLGLALAVLMVLGQTLQAPEWLRNRVETRIERQLAGMQIDFGDVDFTLRHGWRPQLRLRDVVLRDAAGRVVARLADAEASLAMRPLLRGLVQPKRIRLTGAFATLRRDATGALSLSLGDAATPLAPVRSLPELIGQGDRLLQAPALAALTDLEMQGLTLRYEDARQGRGWSLDGGRVSLTREVGALRLASSFALLSGRDFASTVEANWASDIGRTEATFGVTVTDIPAQDVAAQSAVLGWLAPLRAPISGAMRGSVAEDGALGPLSATLRIGRGVLQPTEATRPIPFTSARTYFTYQPSDRLLRFDEIAVASDWVTGSAEGQAWLGGIENGTLTDLTGQIAMTALSLNPADAYGEMPLEVQDVTADFRLELDPFRVTLGQMHLRAGPQQGWASGTFEAAADGWRLALDAALDRVTPARLLALWPRGAVVKPREWVEKNMLGGVISDVNFALRGQPGQPPELYGDFDFAEGRVRFNRHMPPLENAAGVASLAGDRFVVSATQGEITAETGGALDISGTSFIIPDVTIKDHASGIIRARLEGPVTAALSLLNRPPISVLRETDLPVDMAEGHLRAQGTVHTPLEKNTPFEEVEFHAAGTITDLKSDVLIPGRTLRADTLALTADQTRVVLEGEGRVDGVPVTARWRRPIGKGAPKGSRVTGRVALSQDLVDTFDLGLPPGSLSGRGQGEFTLDLGAEAPPRLALRSDLEGLGLTVPALGWTKPRAGAGRFELTGTLGDRPRVDHLMLDAAGLEATGSVLNREGGGLERALLGSVRLGGWLEASLELVGRPGAASPDLRIHGGTLDMRRATFGQGRGAGGAPGPGRIEVSLRRLQVTDTIALTDFSGEFSARAGLQGSFRGRVNGGVAVTGEIVPRGERSAIRLRSDDAGGVFRSAGVLRQASGGRFDLTLIPVAREGEYDGTLRVTDTRIKDAPAIAALLNAASGVGLLDELSGQGIWFSEVDARFRLTPSHLTLLGSSAVGPSMGLSMDGRYDLNAARLDMQGVISPMYLLNGIGSILTRKGEGVIGFNYTLRGPAADPSVQVNPLSALAPGMFREIFRRAPPRIEGAPTPGPAPVREPGEGGISGQAGDR